MTYQNTNTDGVTIGSIDLRVALYEDTNATIDTAKSVGILEGATLKITGEQTYLESDNTEDIPQGAANRQAEIGASAWKNPQLDILYDLLGQTGTFVTIPGTEKSVTGESVVLNGTTLVPLKNKNSSSTPAQVTTVTVKKGSTTYVQDTDYVLALDSRGYTNIQRISGGDITDGDTVTVDYTYTPVANRKLTMGGGKPKPLHVWGVNEDENGKRIIFEFYKVSSITSAEFTMGNDTKRTPMTMPISLIAKPDGTRDASDDLMSIYDEQHVTSEA